MIGYRGVARGLILVKLSPIVPPFRPSICRFWSFPVRTALTRTRSLRSVLICLIMLGRITRRSCWSFVLLWRRMSSLVNAHRTRALFLVGRLLKLLLSQVIVVRRGVMNTRLSV